MRKFCIVLILTSGFCVLAARAQITNLPPTELETFEAQTGHGHGQRRRPGGFTGR